MQISARRSPLAADLPPLRRGNIARDDGALTSVTAGEAAQLAESDPAAHAALRRYVTNATLYTGEERWCIWLDEHDEPLAHNSRFLRERTERVRYHRRRGEAAPWVFVERRQPRRPFLALPANPSASRRLQVALFDPDVIVNGQVWTLDADSLLTAGIVESRVFDVWRTVVESDASQAGRARMAGTGSSHVYNTFPCPKLTGAQRQRIEDAAGDVMLARTHAGAASLDELYLQPELPRPLRAAHERLDAAVDRVFGVTATMSDAEIAEALLDRYWQLIASDVA